MNPQSSLFKQSNSVVRVHDWVNYSACIIGSIAAPRPARLEHSTPCRRVNPPRWFYFW